MKLQQTSIKQEINFSSSLNLYLSFLFLSFIPWYQRAPTALVLMADTPGNTMAASTVLNLWSTIKWTFQWFFKLSISIIITQVLKKKEIKCFWIFLCLYLYHQVLCRVCFFKNTFLHFFIYTKSSLYIRNLWLFHSDSQLNNRLVNCL